MPLGQIFREELFRNAQNKREHQADKAQPGQLQQVAEEAIASYRGYGVVGMTDRGLCDGCPVVRCRNGETVYGVTVQQNQEKQYGIAEGEHKRRARPASASQKPLPFPL